MRRGSKGCRGVAIIFQRALLTLALIDLSALPSLAQTSGGGTAEEWITRLAGLETPPDLDIGAIRQQALERIKSRVDSAPIKRPPLASQLLTLPQLVAD